MQFKRNPGGAEGGTVTSDMVLAALKPVQDPELRKSLVDLGMIQNVKVCGGIVAFEVQLTTPACPLKSVIEQSCREAVLRIPGVETVNITLSSSVPHGRMQDKQELPGVKHIVAVASGKGGVGKSTVTVNMAASLTKSGAKVGILDADIYGPSLPMLLDIQESPLVREDLDPATGEPVKRMVPPEKLGMKLMSLGFLAAGNAPVIWRGPMVASAVKQMLFDTDWGELDYLLVDLPPGTGDAQLSLAQIVPLTGVVIVMTPQDLATMIASKALRMFQQLDVPVLGVVENMASFICPHCQQESAVFGHAGAGEAAAAEFGVRFLGGIPLDPRVVDDSDAGTPTFLAAPDSRPARAYAAIAAQVAAEVSLQSLGEASPKAGAPAGAQ